MATISSFLFCRHLRGESTAHLLFFKNGKLKTSGRGISFWFLPLGASITEVPLDETELPSSFTGPPPTTEEITVQGVITYRVIAPDVLANRVDFTLDTATGPSPSSPSTARSPGHPAGPAARHGRPHPLSAPLHPGGGHRCLRAAIHHGLTSDAGLAAMGLEIVSTRVSSVKATSEMEKALQMPARERIQQQAEQGHLCPAGPHRSRRSGPFRRTRCTPKSSWPSGKSSSSSSAARTSGGAPPRPPRPSASRWSRPLRTGRSRRRPRPGTSGSSRWPRWRPSESGWPSIVICPRAR